MLLSELYDRLPRVPQPQYTAEAQEPRNLVVIYGGRFQPWHRGHTSVYDYLVKNYGRDAVWITTSNKQELPKSPFSFADKAYFMQMQGIPMDRVVETTQPYRAPELTQQFDPANTVLLIALSEKDMAEDPRFKTGYKKDGNPTYFQPMPRNLAQAASMEQHGYLVVVPTVTFTVLGQPMRSATEVRAQYAAADQETRKKIIADLFGKFTPEAMDIMNQKLTEDVMNDQSDSASPIPGRVHEDAAGVGVIASKKQARDPRYMMSLTKDVRPDTMDKMKAAFFPTRYPGKSK